MIYLYLYLYNCVWDGGENEVSISETLYDPDYASIYSNIVREAMIRVAEKELGREPKTNVMWNYKKRTDSLIFDSRVWISCFSTGSLNCSSLTDLFNVYKNERGNPKSLHKVGGIRDYT